MVRDGINVTSGGTRFSRRRTATKAIIIRYRRCTWARNGEKKIVWRRINRLEYGPKYCKQSPTIEEDALHNAIMRALNKAAVDRKQCNDRLKNSISLTYGGGNAFDSVAVQSRIDECSAKIMDWVQKQVKEGSKVKDIDEKIVVRFGWRADIEESL